jgi:hypothetical protein
LARGIVAKGTAIADSASQVLRHQESSAPRPVRVTEPAQEPESTVEADSSSKQAEPDLAPAGPASKQSPAKKSPAKKAAAKKSTAKKSPARKATARKATEPVEPQVVLREPGPPAEPPIDVVGQALANEAEEQNGGRAGEPKAASRDETHGDASLQRAELDEIAEEVAEATPTGDLDLQTPVGTTGADVGRNPDTAEADLQQPGTLPLMDPATTSEVASEQETLRKASAKKKG